MLLTAAIVHDLGKTREFSYGAEIELSREGAMLGHVELGLRVIAEHAPADLRGERRMALEHCVLMHHGADPASGRRFASAEALALYRLNALDAQVKGALEHGPLRRRRLTRPTLTVKTPDADADESGDGRDRYARRLLRRRPTAASKAPAGPQEPCARRASTGAPESPPRRRTQPLPREPHASSRAFTRRATRAAHRG